VRNKLAMQSLRFAPRAVAVSMAAALNRVDGPQLPPAR
jgi:hypothetical protein